MEKADELAEDGATMHWREMVQMRASTVQQKKKGCFCGFASRSQLSHFRWRSGTPVKSLNRSQRVCGHERIPFA